MVEPQDKGHFGEESCRGQLKDQHAVLTRLASFSRRFVLSGRGPPGRTEGEATCVWTGPLTQAAATQVPRCPRGPVSSEQLRANQSLWFSFICPTSTYLAPQVPASRCPGLSQTCPSRVHTLGHVRVQTTCPGCWVTPPVKEGKASLRPAQG